MLRFPTLIVCALLALWSLPSRAQGPVDVSEVLQMRVLPGWREAGGRHVAGLELRLKPGWHTYWRSAGSLGISPAFNWQGSHNVQQVTPIWPRPKVFYEEAGQSYGYEGSFVLPLLIETWNINDATRLEGQVDLGVCAEICVPARVRLAVDLPAPGQIDPAIRAALSKRPTEIPSPARCRIEPDAKGLGLSVEIPIAPLGGREAVVFELPGRDVWITDAETHRSADTLRAQARIIGARSVERSALRVTILGESSAIEFTGCAG